MTVAFVAAFVDSAICNGVFHGTFVFVGMRAVWIAAKADVGSNVTEEAGDLFSDDVPKLELAYPWRVDYIATIG